MVFNNDWLMRQIRGTANMIGKVFKLETIQIDLGMVEDKEGRQISGNDYLNDLVNDEEFDLATEFISGQIKRLSNYQYNRLVDTFIEYLNKLDENVRQRNGIDDAKIQSIREDLRDFKW